MIVLVVADLCLIAKLLSVSGAWRHFGTWMYLVPEPKLFEALGAAGAFCVVVVILSLETRTVQFHRVPVWAFLDIAVCSYIGVIVGVVAANIEVVDCFETHIRRSWKVRLSLSERRWELEGTVGETSRGL